jgi:hypothetical protein
MNVEERGSLGIGGEIDMSISSSHPVTSLVKRDMMMVTWERVGSWHQTDEQDTRLARFGKGIC